MSNQNQNLNHAIGQILKAMNLRHRVEIVRAMDALARSVNDEWVAEGWLMNGVADGDITPETTDEDLACYCEDDAQFAELMGLFLNVMNSARKSGGLYVDGVVSK